MLWLYDRTEYSHTPANTLVMSSTRRPASGPSPVLGVTEAKHLRQPADTLDRSKLPPLNNTVDALLAAAMLGFAKGAVKKEDEQKNCKN